MKITWLGQAGLLFETDNKKIVVDPYLSNSCCEKLNPASYRRVEVDKALLNIEPDIVICTHNHQDHYDEDTLDFYLKTEKSVLCIVPPSCFTPIRKYGRHHNYVYFPAKTQWTEGNIKFTAVKAIHSDPDAIGIILEAENKAYYITGDTLYNTEIFEELPENIDVLFMSVNGVGNNMNFSDASRFADKVKPKKVVPMHLGLMDDRSVNEFKHEKAVYPEFYKEIRL